MSRAPLPQDDSAQRSGDARPAEPVSPAAGGVGASGGEPQAPTPGWLARVPALAWQATRHYVEDHGGIRAAAIAYYALLSFFPFVVLGAVVASLWFDDPAESRRLVVSLRPFLPFLRDDFWTQLLDLIDRQLLHFVARRGLLLAGALVALFVVASRVSVATAHAMNVIFRTPDEPKRPPHHRVLGQLRGFLMTALGLLALAGMFVFRGLTRTLAAWAPDLPAWLAHALRGAFLARVVMPSLILFGLAYSLFRRLPRAHVKASWAVLGAGIFVVGHDLALWAYGDFVAFTARQGPIYGSFVGLVTLTVWVFWVSTLLLWCGEVLAILNGNRPIRA